MTPSLTSENQEFSVVLPKSAMYESSHENRLLPEGAQAILSLRLLIARAASKDSLDWWDDESLTPHASFLLERIFPIAPAGAARSLAFHAALARHRSAFSTIPQALHLYRLDGDGQDTLALRHQSLLHIPVPDEPVSTMDVLRKELLGLVHEPSPYTVVRQTAAHGLQIEIPPTPTGIPVLNYRARALAWAYLEGHPGRPVFPFIIPPAAKELSF